MRSGTGAIRYIMVTEDPAPILEANVVETAPIQPLVRSPLLMHDNVYQGGPHFARGQKMQVCDFGRIRGGKVRISPEMGHPLGLVDGSQAFTTMFRYEHSSHVSYEIVLSTLGPENYREICTVTFNMIDVPGACAQISKFLGERNIDILNSNSLSMISNVCMVWRMMVDLSYYGDSASLREEFDALKKQRSSLLSKVDAMTVESANISERYTRGAVAPGPSIKARPIKKVQKGSNPIVNGEFEIPQEFMNALEGVNDGDPVIMIADQDSWVLSISPLDPKAKLARFEFLLPDKPGAIFEITNAMAQHDINLISVSTKVLVYYNTMSMTVIADVSKYLGDLAILKERTEGHLAKLKGKFNLLSLRAVEY